MRTARKRLGGKEKRRRRKARLERKAWRKEELIQWAATQWASIDWAVVR